MLLKVSSRQSQQAVEKEMEHLKTPLRWGFRRPHLRLLHFLIELIKEQNAICNLLQGLLNVLLELSACGHVPVAVQDCRKVLTPQLGIEVWQISHDVLPCLSSPQQNAVSTCERRQGLRHNRIKECE